MIRNRLYILMGFVLVLGSRVVFASDAEQGEHHLPHNHVALFASGESPITSYFELVLATTSS